MAKKDREKVAKNLSDMKLNASITKIIGDPTQLQKFKKVVWGAGVSGKSFVHMHSDMGFEYITDTRESLQGQVVMGLPIVGPEVLYKEDKKSTLVFVPTVMHKEVSNILRNNGFENIIVPNQFNTSGVGFNINKKDIINVFSWLNAHRVNYVYLKVVPNNFDNLKDVDIMISADDIEKLLECEYMKSEPEAETIYLDVSWSSPLGINAELPFYTRELSDAILDKNNVTYINGVRALKEDMLLYAYVTHALIHKGSNESVKKYYHIIKELQRSTNMQFPITLDGMWNFLKDSAFFPKLDFVRKWATHNNSDFLRSKTIRKKKQGLQLVVFVFRDFFRSRKKLLSNIRCILTNDGYVEKKFIYLDQAEITRAQKYIRGGVWEDSYQSKKGGRPYAVGIYLTKKDSIRKTKEILRKYCNTQCNEEVNCIHSSDDEYEANEYINIISRQH